jgi:hypothetical protein
MAAWFGGTMKKIGTENFSTFSNRGVTKLSATLTILSVPFMTSAMSYMLASIANAQLTPIPAVSPNPTGAISAERQRAQRLFQAITGVKVAIDDARLGQMETQFRAGNPRAAAAIATADPLFLDIQIRDVAKIMSTREQTIRAPMSDFVATFIGVVRDSDTRSAKELLTGNFFYRVDPAVIARLPARATIRQAEQADFIQSNNHYSDLEARRLSPAAVLIPSSPQRALQNNVVINHPDPAGLLTSRAFVAAHAVAGTNRRPVEEMMQEFMCVKMDEWSDSNGSDERVGQDVTRLPSGSVNLYQTTCKACHSGMDGFRGAWAFIDFNNNAQTISTTVLGKMTRNASETTGLAVYQVNNNSWVNYATQGKNADKFGWRSSFSGSGVGTLAKMVADSRGFSRCMVRKAFKAVCRRSPLATEENLIRSLADQFEADGYHMRRMFETVALNPNCSL